MAANNNPNLNNGPTPAQQQQQVGAQNGVDPNAPPVNTGPEAAKTGLDPAPSLTGDTSLNGGAGGGTPAAGSPTTATGGIAPGSMSMASAPPAPVPMPGLSSPNLSVPSFATNTQSYTPSNLPDAALPTYTPANVLTPGYNQTEGMQYTALQNALQSGGSMSPQVVQSLQEQQKEQALGSQKSQAQAMQDRAASLGTYGGGNMQADLNRLGDTTQSNILGANRDIGTQAAQTNYNDQLNAINAVNPALSQGLAGQTAQANQNYLGYQSQADSTRYALQQALAQQQVNQQGAQIGNSQNQLALQSALGQGGLNLDWYKTLLGGQQFGQNLGLQYAQTNQNANQNWLNSILGG